MRRAQHHEWTCYVIRGDMYATNWRVVSGESTRVKRGATAIYAATWPRLQIIARDGVEVWRSSPWLRWAGGLGELAHIAASAPRPQTCNGPGVICSPPTGCRDWGMLSHAATCSRSCSYEGTTSYVKNKTFIKFSAETMNPARLTWKQSMQKQMWSSDTVMGNHLVISVNASVHLGSALTAHHTSSN